MSELSDSCAGFLVLVFIIFASSVLMARSQSLLVVALVLASVGLTAGSLMPTLKAVDAPSRAGEPERRALMLDDLLACAEKCEGKNQYSGTCGGLAENSDKWCEAGDKDKEMYIMVCCANSSSECCDPNIGAIVGIVIAIVVVLAVAITGCAYCCKCCCFSYRKNAGGPPQVAMMAQGQVAPPKV